MQIRSRVVFAVVTIAILAITVSCGQAPAEPSAEANPLLGVWSMSEMTPSGEATITPSQPGLFIFTEEHYSAVYSLGSEARPRSAASFDATPEEKVAQYDTIIVNTGTYDVNGSTIAMRPLVAKSPEFVGGQSTMDFHIDGDVLTLTEQRLVAADGVPAPDVPGSSMTLRRIG